jgi:hypothetical protein
MKQIVLSLILTTLIMYGIAFVVYGSFSAVTGLEPPQGVSVIRFQISVLIVNIGVAIAFVLLFYLTREVFAPRWILYAFIWWLMFAIGEIGQAIGPNYSWSYAILGIIAEAIYFPLSALLVRWLFSP